MTPPLRLRRRSLSVALVVGATLLACGEAPPAALAPDFEAALAQGAAPSIAVRGSLAGSATPTLLDAAQMLYRVDVVGTGVITGVGRVSARWALPGVVLDLASGHGVALNPTWSGVITAQNGDQLQGRYTLRGTDVPVDLTGSFAVTADLVLTGGTGRFAGASGSGVALVSGNVVTQGMSVELAGALAVGGGK